MKKITLTLAFLVAIGCAFAFKGRDGGSRAIKLSTQTVYYSPTDCNHSTTCKNTSGSACVTNQTMYDQSDCTVTSAFQFRTP